MISAGHYGAAHAGFCILEAGGNAVDAGVAAGICLGVLQTDIVNVAGVAPIMLWLADRREVVTIDGLGVWPRAGTTSKWWPDLEWRAGAVCAIVRDPKTGLLIAGTDPRRPAYALGW